MAKSEQELALVLRGHVQPLGNWATVGRPQLVGVLAGSIAQFGAHELS